MAIPHFRVPLNLKHAATISKRLVFHVQRLKAVRSENLDTAQLLATVLVDQLRMYGYSDDNPPLEEAKRVVEEAAAQAREFVAEIERLKAGDDRLGQAVRNLFECLELGEEGAEISLRAGESPDSALRPTEVPRQRPELEPVARGAKAPLSKRKLGSTGMLVTPIGLGGAWLGQTADGFSDEIAIATVHRALERGINLIDTSPLYGESERRVGLALEAWYQRGGKRDDFVLTTKTGTRTQPRDYSGPGTRRSVEESLRLLKTDYLDVVLVHDPGDLAPALEKGGAFDELAKMKSEKLIKAVGLGVRDHEFHRRCIEAGVVDMCLTYRDFNLVSQSALRGVIEPAAIRGVGVVNATVVMSGLLGGKDPRLSAPKPSQTSLYFPQKPEIDLACKLWDFANARGISLLALNLQWVLRESSIASTLLGVANVAELDEDLAALTQPIPENVWRELREHFGI